MIARRALAALATGALASLLLAAPTGAQSKRNVFEEAAEAYRSGDYAKSQRLLREYVQGATDKTGKEPAHLGEAYRYLGIMSPDAKLAEGYFLAVVQRYPTSAAADEALVRLAELYTAQGRYADARREWSSLAANYPVSRYLPEADLHVGQAYFAERDYENAYDAFTSGFAKMKTFQRSGGQGADLAEIEGEYVYWLGRTLLARKAYGDARKYLNLVLLDYPNHWLEPLALYYLSQSYRAEGKEKEADDAWRRFSEAVRSTSLESVAQSPNLVAVAQAREAGALKRPAEADERMAAAREREAARRAPLTGAEAQVAEGHAAPGGTGPSGESTGEEGEERAAAPEPAERRPALRAPEPGRAGGAVGDTTPTAPGAPAEPAADERAREQQVVRRGQEIMAADTAAPAAPPAPVAAAPAAAAVAAPAPAGVAAPARASAPAAAPAPATAPPPARVTGPAPSPIPGAGIRPSPAPGRTPPAAAPGEAGPPGAPSGAAGPEARPSAPAAPAPSGAATPPSGGIARPAAGPAASGPALEPIEPGSVFLQLGAFSSATSASAFAKSLRGRKFDPQIKSGLLNGKAFYRVLFGPYQVPGQRDALEAQRSRLLKAGYVPVVTRQEAGSTRSR